MLVLFTPFGIVVASIVMVIVKVSGLNSWLFATLTVDQSPKNPVQSNVVVTVQILACGGVKRAPSCTVTGIPELCTVAAVDLEFPGPTESSPTVTLPESTLYVPS